MIKADKLKFVFWLGITAICLYAWYLYSHLSLIEDVSGLLMAAQKLSLEKFNG